MATTRETRSRGLRPLSRSLYPFARLFEALSLSRSRALPSHIGRNDATSGTPLGSPRWHVTRWRDIAMRISRFFPPSFFLFLFSFSFYKFLSVKTSAPEIWRNLTRFDEVWRGLTRFEQVWTSLNYYISKEREVLDAKKVLCVVFSFFSPIFIFDLCFLMRNEKSLSILRFWNVTRSPRSPLITTSLYGSILGAFRIS